MVKGVLYTTGGTRRSVVALDAKTGELIWVYQHCAKAIAPRSRPGSFPAAASLTGPTARATTASSYVTTGYRLVELNAHTGAADPRPSARTAWSI